MRKVMTSLLSLALILGLVACGSDPAPAPAPDPPPPAEYEFGLTVTDLTEKFDFLPGDPDISQVDEYGEAGPCSGYQYSLGNGSTAVIYVTEANYIAGFFVTFDTETCDDETLKTSANVIANIVALFVEDLDAVTETLFSDLSDGAYNHLSDGPADMAIMVDGTTVYFMANPIA